MNFIDANVIIKSFVDNEDKDKCRKIMSEGFVVDTLCLVEAQHVISIIKGDKAYASNCIKSLFKSRGIIVGLDKNLLFEAFRRIDKYELDIFDLVHYSAALINNCPNVVSYDKDFDDLEIKRIEP